MKKETGLIMEKDSGRIIFLNSVYTHNIWGGSRLSDEYNAPVKASDLGECWGISAHENGDCRVSEGPYSGLKLSELWKLKPDLFGHETESLNNSIKDEFPLLVKIIDAKEDLSIQVHPGDSFANEYENHSFGKTECWYVLDCPENAGLIIGHNASSTEEMIEMIDEKRWGEFLREVPVKKGDFIQIDPGTVHAIKKGFVILETQQSSNITYRVYDYDRTENGRKRELHTEKCKKVIKTPSKEPAECIISAEKLNSPDNTLDVMYAGMYYSVFKMEVRGDAFLEQKYRFLNVTVTDGIGSVDGHIVKKGQSFILPYKYGVAHFEGSMELIASAMR